MTMESAIRQKLEAAFAPELLTIENESERHAHHREMLRGPAAQTGETHFRISIVSPAFAGKSRVERHRMVYGLLAEEMAGPVHALAITALAPGETG